MPAKIVDEISIEGYFQELGTVMITREDDLGFRIRVFGGRRSTTFQNYKNLTG